MKYKFLYLVVFAIFISPFSIQATATEPCDGPGMFNPEKPLMDDEKPKPEGGEGEEEEEPDCDD